MHSFLGIVLLLLILAPECHGRSEEQHQTHGKSSRLSVKFADIQLVSISVSNGGKWGNWADIKMCPRGSFAKGFSLKVEADQGDGDDTAVNGIRLKCISPLKPSEVDYVESGSQRWGSWTTMQECGHGGLSAFQLRVEEPQGHADDTSLNNIRFLCGDGAALEGHGLTRGSWGPWSPTCVSGGICGLWTRVESWQIKGDDTALNDVKFVCCPN
ncbi:vitelline membrane outer layer protein 1-like [Denticeps clupeoides]|uniref:Vitelline membrane outer layer protein 1 homolog n=1 Tax=Denticeps clupeoides TaxID=299321 RepID=A0AAY4CMX4_9TELE|nr:vitelline membrane outer layer protein 1-like [Denticeps clupeoides]